MSNTSLHEVAGDLYVVADGPSGQVVKIDSTLAPDIRALIAARQQVGKDISKRLKHAGLGIAKDDEETVVVTSK